MIEYGKFYKKHDLDVAFWNFYLPLEDIMIYWSKSYGQFEITDEHKLELLQKSSLQELPLNDLRKSKILGTVFSEEFEDKIKKY
jgi:hypothetical protein